MKIAFITRKKFLPTVRNLKNEFQKQGFEVNISFNPDIAIQRFNKNTIIIRYGNFAKPRLFSKLGYITINDELITTNKLIQSFLLKNNGIFVPNRIFSPILLSKNEKIIVRKKHHMQSKDAHIISKNEYEEFSAYDDFMKLYEIEKEFRVHVFRDCFSFVQVKRIKDEKNFDPIFRCYKTGWKLDKTKYYPEEIIEIAEKAIKALNLDFGGVDIGILKENGKPIVFEVNSSCGVSENNAPLYFQGLFGIIKEKFQNISQEVL